MLFLILLAVLLIVRGVLIMDAFKRYERHMDVSSVRRTIILGMMIEVLLLAAYLIQRQEVFG